MRRDSEELSEQNHLKEPYEPPFPADDKRGPNDRTSSPAVVNEPVARAAAHPNDPAVHEALKNRNQHISYELSETISNQESIPVTN